QEQELALLAIADGSGRDMLAIAAFVEAHLEQQPAADGFQRAVHDFGEFVFGNGPGLRYEIGKALGQLFLERPVFGLILAQGLVAGCPVLGVLVFELRVHAILILSPTAPRQGSRFTPTMAAL